MESAVHINRGLTSVTPNLSRYVKQVKGHTEKGRDPINARESVLKAVADATSTNIPRWCKYDEASLQRALIRLGEATNVKNRAAYFIWLLKNP